MPPLRLAIVGCGSITERGLLPHLELETDLVKVVALSDISEDRLRHIALQFDVRQTYVDFKELLKESDAEAVVIATPMAYHYEQTKLALTFERHVYVQKPMTGTAQEAAEIIELSRERHLTLAASPGQMLLPAYEHARQLVKDGAIGTVYMAIGVNMALGHEHETLRLDTGSGLDPGWYYKPGGGPLRDMGVYSLHAITGILGPAKKAISLGTSPVPHRDWKGKEISVQVPDNEAVLLQLGQNQLATIAATYSVNPIILSWGLISLSGSEGTIEVRRLPDNPSSYQLIHHRAGKPEPKEILFGTGLSQDHDRLEEAHVARDLMDFVDSVRNRRSPGADPWRAAHVVEIIEAAERSRDAGHAIEIGGRFASNPEDR